MIPGITASTRRGATEPPCEGIGCPMDGGFYAGDIQIEGYWYKLIVADKSADITGDDSRWKTTDTETPNTNHLVDGEANTYSMIAAGIEDHPAANHCVNYDGGGYTDWYMPAIEELYVIYQNLGPNTPDCPPIFQAGGSQAFSGAWYRASTQTSPTHSRLQLFSQHLQINDLKSLTGYRVRPVRRAAYPLV